MDVPIRLHIYCRGFQNFSRIPAPRVTKYNSSMPELSLRIRNYQVEDLEVLCEIDRICFPEDIAFSRSEFVFYLNHPRSIAWVGERLGRILGFVVARIESPARAHVITLDVTPDARHRQVGTSLMNALHRELEVQKIGAAILEVSVHNLPAQRLYEKLQYRYLETLSGYYGGKEDAFRMERLFS
jgi:ribosomal-protein-alanine N-acetyltransferase